MGDFLRMDILQKKKKQKRKKAEQKESETYRPFSEKGPAGSHTDKGPETREI